MSTSNLGSGAHNVIACPADAGTRGFFGKGDMQKEFEEAAFALKPGEVSQVVQTASGLHLIER